MGKFAVAVSTTLLFFLGSFAYAPSASAWTNSSNTGYYKGHTKNKNGNMSFGNHGKWDGKRYANHDNRDNNHKKHFKKSSYKKHDSNNFVKRDNNHNSYGNHRNDGNVNGRFGGDNKWG